jgi:virginiamycin B lyase
MSRLPARCLSVVVFSALLAAVAASAQTFTEYAVPTANSGPMGITVGADGALWFVENLTGRVGRVTTGGLITDYAAAPAAAAPRSIAPGSDAALWFTQTGAGKLGRMDTFTNESDHDTAAAGLPSPREITAGPDQRLWFTDGTGRIGAATAAGVVTAYSVPNGSGGLEGITAGPDGNLWFVESLGRIGRITPSGTVTEFPPPGFNSLPLRITAGPDGNLWFTENLANKIGRITPAGVITEFPIPTTGARPLGIAAGHDGNLWFTESGTNKLGRITTAGVVSEYSIPTAASVPTGIVAGPDGNIWFTENGSNKVGRINIGGPCVADVNTLCLDGGRFRVQSTWRVPAQGTSGSGTAVALSADTGYFWFFASSNLELVVKVLNGCGVNSHHWIFAGGLTDVEVVLTATDTTTGEARVYTNAAGTAFLPIQDTSAFSRCP